MSSKSKKNGGKQHIWVKSPVIRELLCALLAFKSEILHIGASAFLPKLHHRSEIKSVRPFQHHELDLSNDGIWNFPK